ncbi:MAG: hypothetical protein H0Z18_01675 [Thermococcus sp.]|uniref:hypothetical protein n=1 Tax=Thermococcus sp. TaxID=35749 RepID=UPI001D1B8B33|nr:hypothetical protein [Thermococcus sp.]MBO8173947.1 hypothetical protein [Thermococcus sp.]
MRRVVMILALLLLIFFGMYHKTGEYISSVYVSEAKLGLVGVSKDSLTFILTLVVPNPITLDLKYTSHNFSVYYDDNILAIVNTSSGMLIGGSKNTIIYTGQLPIEALKEWFYYHASHNWHSTFYAKGKIVVEFGPIKAPIYVHSKIEELHSNPFVEIVNKEFLGQRKDVGYYKLQYPSVKFSKVTWDGKTLRMKITYINNSTSPILIQFPTYEFRANNILLGTTITDSILIPGESTVESEIIIDTDTQNIGKFLLSHFSNGEKTVFELSMEGTIKYLGITKRGKIFDIKFEYKTHIFSQ